SRTLLTGSADGTAQLWEVATGQPRLVPNPKTGPPVISWMRHAGPVEAVAFSRDGKRVATAGAVGVFEPAAKNLLPNGGEARRWAADTGLPVSVPMPHPAAVLAVAFSPDGQYLLTGCLDMDARLFDCATGRPFGNRMPTGGVARVVGFTRDGRTAL